MARRIIGFFCVFALLTITVVSCTKKSSDQPDTLIVAIEANPKTLDPRYATDAMGMRIVGLLFSSLVRVGPQLNIVGDAAQRWEYKDKTYTFYLHPHMSFSNGRPLNEQDILFSFDQYRSPDNPFHSAFNEIESVHVNNTNEGLKIIVKMKNFSAKFLTSDLPVLKILPKQEVEKAGKDFQKKLIGTGSFELVDQSANSLTLKARRDHPWAPPKVAQLVFKVIRDDFTRYQKTLRGNIDIVPSNMPASKVVEFEKRKSDFVVIKTPGLSMTYLLFNLKDPDLAKIKFRKAIAQSIHRKDIIQYKLEGLAQEATSILTPGNPFFHKELQNRKLDPAHAKKVIAQLGLGQKAFTIKTSNTQAAIENGRVLVNQLSKVGLHVQLQSFEWGTFYSDIRSGNFQMATLRWVGAYDPDVYRIAFHSQEKPPGRNRGYYLNKKLDRLLEDGLQIEDQTKRIDHYKKVQEIVMKDLPILPLWYDQQVIILNKRVKGFEPSQSGNFYPFIFVSKEKK